MQGQRESIGIARACEQLFRDLRFMGFGFDRGDMAEYRWRNNIGCRYGCILHEAFDDHLAIDRFGDRQAHIDVFQWVLWQRLAGPVGDEGRYLARLIGMNKDGPPGYFLRQPEALVCPNARQIRCGNGLYAVDIAS